jgi:acetylcholinesterase
MAVWHRGGFIYGDKSIIDGSDFVSRATGISAPIITVSINYRLSFLGFPEGLEAGRNDDYSVGLKDQRLALKWVTDHIRVFHGDPSR